ncbi:hypothetical protein BT63DRAFT_150164 [Microthyrium microscopicum]|uniref:Uncharacterized protein n=1 Tax=Microthyrium microscopicum TaxID=703497 RepID=A0A6A6UND6_9PEZI|nr:hypothetical protein BT63DRAFT_150164 [Microthyrium microscopicum]
MGGNAFSTLDTPRLSHEQWELLRVRCIKILLEFYEQVVCPPEAPEKVDHGDVDLLVEAPKHPIEPDTLQNALGAVSRTKVGVTMSFAVPLPETQESFAQIDVHICGEGNLQWELWMASYGDLVQILGHQNRGIGLTMNDKGLNVRVPEVEITNRKQAMILLTKEPIKVMQFLGLDAEHWQRGFATLEDLFFWCSAGRFYNKPKSSDAAPEQTTNDRARLKKRPMFANYFYEWIPAHPEAWQNDERVQRDVVLQEAIKSFGVRTQYEAIMTTWRQEVNANDALISIKESLPITGSALGLVLKGIKRWVTFKDGQPQMRPLGEPEEDITKLPDWLPRITSEELGQLNEWLQKNWPELKSREKHRSEARRELGQGVAGSMATLSLLPTDQL